MSLPDRLNDAVRAIVRDELNRPAPTPADEKLAWGSLIFLCILAIDISAIIWALAGVLKHPVVKLVVQSLPALVGVGLAAYKEHLQAAVRRVANEAWFRIAVSVALVVIVYPIVKPYRLPLRVWSPKTEILVDGRQVNAVRDSAGVTRIPVSGLVDHELSISGYVTGSEKKRIDRYHVRASDLLRTLYRADTTGLGVGLLVPLTIYTPDLTIESIVVSGELPELFTRGTPEPFEKIKRLANGDYEVTMRARDGLSVQEVALPTGNFAIRYVGSQCVSQPTMVSLTDRKAGNTELVDCR